MSEIEIIHSINSAKFFVLDQGADAGRGKAHELKAETLPGAVREADRMGLRATHWISRDNRRAEIPSGIVREPVKD